MCRFVCWQRSSPSYSVAVAQYQLGALLLLLLFLSMICCQGTQIRASSKGQGQHPTCAAHTPAAQQPHKSQETGPSSFQLLQWLRGSQPHEKSTHERCHMPVDARHTTHNGKGLGAPARRHSRLAGDQEASTSCWQGARLGCSVKQCGNLKNAPMRPIECTAAVRLQGN